MGGPFNTAAGGEETPEFSAVTRLCSYVQKHTNAMTQDCHFTSVNFGETISPDVVLYVYEKLLSPLWDIYGCPFGYSRFNSGSQFGRHIGLTS